MRKFGITAALGASALVAVVVLLVGVAPQFSGAADHLEAPFVRTDGRIDINDVYAFQSPSNPDNTVLIMTVNPLAGIPGFSPTTLRPGAAYEFAIDNDGDAVEDIVYRIKASAPGNGTGAQNVNLHKATGGGGGESIAKGQTESTIPVNGGGELRIGLHDDPFFFDFAAFGAGLNFCPPSGNPNSGSGIDFFAGLNVTAIVLEVPTADLLDGTPNIGVWGRIVLNGKQVERMGRPVINTALIPSGSKDDFNATAPADDVATWTADVTASLISLNGNAAYSATVAAILLPDILTIDTSAPSGFLNGRTLDDDVGDTVLAVVSNSAITSDCVDANDAAFLDTFPYLAPAN